MSSEPASLRRDRRAGRVVGAHRIAIGAFRLTAVFVVMATVWAVGRQIGDGGTWWGPLHLFMVGGVLLAISGASQLFSITWSAAAPPGATPAAIQRWSTALGAAAVVVGVSESIEWLTLAGAGLVVLGLGVLIGILAGVRRRSLLRRFGLPGRFYLLALVVGVIGVVLGAVIGAGSTALVFLDARTAHMHLNLVGLVGFTIFGTLPTLLPTTTRHPMVSGREAVVAFWLCAGSSVAMATGAWVGPRLVGLGTLLATAAGLLLLGGIVVRLGAPRIARSSLPGLLITTGTLWLLGWSAHQSMVLLSGRHTVFAAATAAGVGGVALVLFGALAYLVPVLAGPGAALGTTLPIMSRWAVARVLIGNAVVAAAVVGVTSWAVVAVAAAWVADFGRRALRIVIGRPRLRLTGD